MQQQQITVSPSGKVFLKLPGKHYKARRHIGTINGTTLHVERDPSKHFFRQFNGYGFSYELVRDAPVKFVVVHLPFGVKLETTREHILAKGRMLNFAKNLLERQIFLSVEEFGLERAEETEKELAARKRKTDQGNLFEGVERDATEGN